MSALRRLPRTTARRRRILAPLPAVLAVLLGMSAFAPTAAAAESVSPTPSADDGSGPQLTLEPVDDGLVGTEPITANVTVQAPIGLAGVPEGTVTLRIGTQPIADRAALDQWLDGADSTTFTDLDTADSDALAVGGTTTVALAEDTRPTPRAPGVYPLRAVLSAGGEQYQDDRLVLIEGETSPAVTVVVPITAPATDRGLLTADQLAALTAPDGSLSTQLEAAAGTQAALAVDPAIPAAIRVLGAQAPASALAWLERLETISNERFALAFGDADPSVQVAGGVSPPLTPISLAPYLPGAGGPEPTATPTPSPTPSPTSTAAPDPTALDPAELLSIGTALPGLQWPDPNAVDTATVEALAAAGETSLVPSTATAAGVDGSAVPSRGDGALVYDADASDLLSQAAATAEQAERDPLLDAARASMWLAAAESGAPVLVALARQGGVDTEDDAVDRDPSPRPADAVHDAVVSATSFDTRPLSALLADAPRPVEIAGPGPASDRVAAIAELHHGEQRLAQVGTVLSDPTLLTARARAEELQLLGAAWSLHPEAWAAAMEGQRASLAELANGVGIVVSDVQLVSSEAPLPVWIRNDLPYPVTVTLITRPDDTRLAVQRVTEVVAAPDQNTRVRIPVEATIGSGQVRLDLSLVSPTGESIGTAQSMNVTVRADWERVGIVILSVLIVGLVVLGTIRTVRRRRRRADDTGEASDG
ncbi:DUF6049 family protein [Microbacterium sediminis]|uniref:DUF6049 family protein n=1 Tax=Microbacterium sediminis TaxID=904291 RepID=UPI000A80AB13|nr:DUF6049 family protein [Microbacterium sediminis]